MTASFSLKEKVLSSVGIFDVVSKYVELKPVGGKFKGLSPFKSEKTPSFFVDPEKNLFYCFATQKGGDIFTFIEMVESVDFKSALILIAERAGIDPKEFSFNTGKSNEIFLNEKKDLFNQLNIIKNIYKQNLTPEVITYLKDRGLDDVDIKKWEIGFAKDEWNNVCKASNKKILKNTGVCVENNNSFYDRFRNRIQFPFHDVDGNIIGFIGRSVDDNKEIPKYINISQTAIFEKSKYLYGLYFSKENIKKNNLAIVMEGAFDVILAHKHLYPITIAPSGTALTSDHLLYLRRITSNVILAFDSDSAGFNATIKAITLAVEFNFDIRIFDGKEGEDPASLILKDPLDFKTRVKNSKPYLIYLLSAIRLNVGDNMYKFNDSIKTIVFPILLKIKDPVLIELALKDIAKESLISYESLNKSFEDYKIETPTYTKPIKSNSEKKIPTRSSRIDSNKIESHLTDLIYFERYCIKNKIELTEAFKERINSIKSTKRKIVNEIEKDSKLDEIASMFVDQNTKLYNLNYSVIYNIKLCLDVIEPILAKEKMINIII